MTYIIKFWQGAKKSPSAFLSNFYHHPFDAPDNSGRMQEFQFSEQYFMYLKALHFDQPGTAQYILDNPDLKPQDYKHIGRKLPDYKTYGPSWESNRVKVMTKAVYYKFSNPALKKMLKDTGDSYLVEASPYDDFWGAGVDSSKIKRVEDITGSNYLGKILMAVRGKLK